MQFTSPSIPSDQWEFLYKLGATKYIGLEVSLNGQDFSTAAPSSWLTYYNETLIQKVSPLAGSISGGTVISIGGDGLEFAVATDLPRCRFNRNFENTALSPGVQAKATKLPGREEDREHAYSCVLPVLPNIGKINVEFALNGQQFVSYTGNEVASKSLQGYYNSGVMTLTPNEGLATGGVVITLHGVDFRLQPSKTLAKCRFEADARDVAAGKPDWAVTTGMYIDTIKMSCVTPAGMSPVDPLGSGRVAKVEYTLNGKDWAAAPDFTVKPLPPCYSCSLENGHGGDAPWFIMLCYVIRYLLPL